MGSFISLIARRGKLAFQTAVIVALLLGLRFAVEEFDWEFVEVSSLLTALVSGGIFVVALVVAGTLTDYKESERVPAEIVAGLSSIHTDGTMFKKEKAHFDLAGLERRLRNVVLTFRSDLEKPGERTCVAAVNAISESFAEMDRLEVIATYISRLRGEQSAIRKSVLRVYHIQQTEFVPSAYMLIWTVLFVAVGMLTFTENSSSAEAYVLLGAIYFLLLYLARLLRILDTPFQPRRFTNDDVDLFLLDDFAASMEDNKASTNSDGGVHWDARQFASDVAVELARLTEHQKNS
ncbi:MAG: hypothetical protein WD598_16735 [Acidimicrobiia bacterium]